MRFKFLLTMFLWTVSAFGAEPIERMVSESIASSDLSMAQYCQDDPESDQGILLERIYISVKSSASFDVSGAINLTVTPQLSFVWERDDEDSLEQALP